MPAVAHQGIWGCVRNEGSYAQQHALPLVGSWIITVFWLIWLGVLSAWSGERVKKNLLLLGFALKQTKLCPQRTGSAINSAWSAWDSMVLVGKETLEVTLHLSLPPSSTLLNWLKTSNTQYNHHFANCLSHLSNFTHFCIHCHKPFSCLPKTFFTFTTTLGSSWEDFPSADVQVTGWDPEPPCAMATNISTADHFPHVEGSALHSFFACFSCVPDNPLSRKHCLLGVSNTITN